MSHYATPAPKRPVCCRDRRLPRPRCLNRPDCRCGTVAHHGLPSCCIPLPSHLLTWLSSPWSCSRRIGYSCFCRCHLSSAPAARPRSEEHTSELQSLMRISYAVFCLTKKTLSILQPQLT